MLRVKLSRELEVEETHEVGLSVVRLRYNQTERERKG